MDTISFPKINKLFIYPNSTYNIINTNYNNHMENILYNYSSHVFNNNYIDLKDDKYTYNVQGEQKNENIKEMKLNRIKNIPISNNLNNDFSLEYVPFSSRERKNMNNNFNFYNNGENKTINGLNEINNLEDKAKVNKYSINENPKNDLKTKRILYKSQIHNNSSVSRKLVHPFLKELNLKNSLTDSNQNQFYETPKNILLSKKIENNYNVEINGKTKYKKIFNENKLKEGINEKNQTIEKNGYISYNNIHKKPEKNNIKINARYCISPFLNNRYMQKFEKNNKKHQSNKIIQNNININTDINNNIDLNHKNEFNSNHQMATENQNSVYINKPKILYFSSNFEDVIDDIKENNKLNNDKILDKEPKEINKKENMISRDVLLSDDFDYLDNKIINSHRYTNYENRKIKIKIKNNLKNNTELFPENKENINSIVNIIQDSILEDDPINNFNLESRLNDNIKKRKKKTQKEIKNNKNFSYSNNNLNTKNIRKKVYMINNSEIIKGDFTLNNVLKKDELGNNLNTEIRNYKLKNPQIISLSKKPQDDISKVKGELKEYKNKNNNKKSNNINNKALMKNNKEIKIKRSKYDSSKVNIKNKYNYKNNNLSKNPKINIKDNKNFAPKLNQKENIQNNKNNSNLDLFLKNSSLLNDSKKLLSHQSQTTLCTSNNFNKFPSNSYKAKYSKIDTTSEEKENKYIFSFYYSTKYINKKKQFQISALCFDPEDGS